MANHTGLVVIALAAFMLLAACGPVSRPIEGEYEVVSTLRPNSLSVVRLEVKVDFLCPACARFERQLQAMQQRYGAKLDVVRRPVIHHDGQNEFAVRVYYAARSVGDGDAVADLLYAAAAGKQPTSTEPDVRKALAPLNLPERVYAQASSPEVTAELAAASEFGRLLGMEVPMVLVEDRLSMLGIEKNLDRIIDQLLIAP